MQTLARLFLGAALALLPSAAYPQAQQSGITPVTLGKVISATTSSSCVTMGSQGSTAIMWNTGSVGARYNVNGATAVLTNPYLPPGSAVTLNIAPSASICAITASGSTTLELTQGFGWPSLAFGGAVSIAGTVSVTQGTNPWIVAGGGTAGTAATGVLTVQGIASMTPLLATLSAETSKVIGTVNQGTSPWVVSGTVQPGNTPNTTPWLTTNIPSSASGAALTKSATQAAASNAVAKSGAGNLYGLTVTIGATAGWVMVFDATALPSNGATGASMIWCYPVNSDGTKGGIDKEFGSPIPFTTGLTLGFSSTACNSLTASATAFFYGRVM